MDRTDGARYYDKHLGAFISPDPLIPDPTDIASYNRYLYANGNPIKYNDPSGHFVVTATLVVGVVVLAGLTAASLQYYNYYFWQPDAEQHRADLGAAVEDLGSNIGTWLAPPAELTIDQESLPLPTQEDEPGGYVLEEDVAPGIHGIEPAPEASELIVTEIAPSESPIWQELQPYRRGIRTNGLKGKKARFYTWDPSHAGEIEVYDRRGDHLGVINPITGEQIKDAVPGRTNPDVK